MSLGNPRDDFGGSVWADVTGRKGGRIQAWTHRNAYRALHSGSCRTGLIRSCHDVSEGAGGGPRRDGDRGRTGRGGGPRRLSGPRTVRRARCRPTLRRGRRPIHPRNPARSSTRGVRHRVLGPRSEAWRRDLLVRIAAIGRRSHRRRARDSRSSAATPRWRTTGTGERRSRHPAYRPPAGRAQVGLATPAASRPRRPVERTDSTRPHPRARTLSGMPLVDS